ncbi:MAG: hypothetical protein HZC48_11955 [Nitrospirae bacterium]|nr:hypothetical protein [Nitrospirota bacterium]
MKKHILLPILVASAILSLNFLVSDQCFSLEKETHKALNEHISKTSINNFQLNTFLSNQLGFEGGINKSLNGKEVWKWVRDGGSEEDEPMYTRSLNHFHDPLKTWDIAGFKGTSKSAILWAHDQGLAGFLTGGDFSWKDVREYFYIALTGKDFSGAWLAYSQAEKEMYYKATFRGMGHLMHLVEDMSVPAHTRDDSHVAGYHYESAVDKFRESEDPNEKEIFDYAIAHPITFDPSILNLPPNPLASIPIAKIFDTDKYNNPNPDPNVCQWQWGQA